MAASRKVTEADIDEGCEVVVALMLLCDRAEKCGLTESARKLKRVMQEATGELATLNNKVTEDPRG
jgi:hypothetical protein